MKVSAGAGYRELKRIGNYVAPQINKAADRTGASIDKAIAANVAEKDKFNKRVDDALSGITVDVDALQSKATGFETRDDQARDYVMGVRKRSEEHAEAARKAALAGDWEAVHNYKGKIARLKGDFKNTVNDEAILKETFDKYRTDWQNGDIDDDEWLAFGESIENFDFETVLDENDNKVVRALVRDDEGNVTHIEEKKWSELVNRKDRPFEVVRLEDKQGKKGLIGDLLSTMGKRKYDEQTGQFITTKQTWDDIAEKQFKAKVIGLQSNDRTMHSLLKQAGGESKKSGFTEADDTLVENFLRDQVKGGYDTTESKKVRGLTPEEQQKENARTRAVTRRGQDIGAEKQAEQDRLNWDKQALAWWKAKNPNIKVGGSGSTAQETTAKVARLYDIATQISNTDLNDNAVQKVLDETGLGFIIDTDWQLGAGINNLFGGDYNQFDLGRIEDIDQKDVFKIVKGLARKAGLDLEDTDIRDVIERERDTPSQPDNNSTTPQTTQTEGNIR